MYEVYRGSVRVMVGYDNPEPGYIKELLGAGYKIRRDGKTVTRKWEPDMAEKQDS